MYFCKEMKDSAEELLERRTLPDEGLRDLLEGCDASQTERLHRYALETSRESFHGQVYLRALIEWSNVCRNDCLYCGIRRSNGSVRRYTLSREEILSSCQAAYGDGLRTFVLQGGENPAATGFIAGTVAEIKASWPDCAVTLSLGELTYADYAQLRKSGADRYLLRHETADPVHYSTLHPAGMKLSSRLACLEELRRLGFQTGMGMMVGSPRQTVECLIADLRLMERLRPQMIGAGPFIPHHETPFRDYPSGSAELTLRLYSILRLMFPKALIPSTTALSTVMEGGRTAGILAGANVIMPNYTPSHRRGDYTLYEGKDAPRIESKENLGRLEVELAAVGWSISSSRGDYEE